MGGGGRGEGEVLKTPKYGVSLNFGGFGGLGIK
jgi:hypothetical protein